ncbi:MAG: hypothetical protein ACHQ4J_01510 [Candidatus Binatia bacterium]
MPRLQVFAVCRDVITSQEENVPTLVSIIDGFVIHVSAGHKFDLNIAMPASWAVFISWRKVRGDEGKHFEQRLRMKLPNGEYVTDILAQFDFPAQRKIVRVTQRTIGFPVQVGEYLIELEIREVGAADWVRAADYIMEVGMVQDAESTE